MGVQVATSWQAQVAAAAVAVSPFSLLLSLVGSAFSESTLWNGYRCCSRDAVGSSGQGSLQCLDPMNQDNKAA